MVRLVAILCIVFVVEGCYTTTVRVDSDPSGATVHYDYEPKGVTPTEFNVDWYGKHRLTLDHPEYGQRVEIVNLRPPAYLFFPFDLLVAIMPFHVHDVHEFSIDLTTVTSQEEVMEDSNHDAEGTQDQ
jgi:hypothetical protein